MRVCYQWGLPRLVYKVNDGRLECPEDGCREDVCPNNHLVSKYNFQPGNLLYILTFICPERAEGHHGGAGYKPEWSSGLL